MLKLLIKSKLTENQCYNLLDFINLFKENNNSLSINEYLYENIKSKINSNKKRQLLFEICDEMTEKNHLMLFQFSLKLYLIKDLLLSEAKMSGLLDSETLEKLHPLSVEYDRISRYKPYAMRVNGALLSLLFFSKIKKEELNFMTNSSYEFLKKMSNTAFKLKKLGIEPNQIFMLMFSESINQSIISQSGTDYENRILSILTGDKVSLNSKDITKIHDDDDPSTEFDFFFEIDGITYGIGAKRTLRERYKQFIKTAQMSEIDVMIEITLGLDLNKQKAKNIAIDHGIIVFVSDEIYSRKKFLQEIKNIYSVKDLNLNRLKKIAREKT